MARTRRGLITSAGLAFGGAILGSRLGLAQQAPTTLGADQLILLGTGGEPFVSGFTPGRPANLLVYKNKPYLVDAGYGVTLKLVEAGLPLPALQYIFITHHHSDHNIDLGRCYTIRRETDCGHRLGSSVQRA